jgi:hydroxyethylthiazole kinase-like uncharacterized protein yjeF
MMPDPHQVTDGLLRSWPLPRLGDTATKEARGQVLVVGGAAQTPGAVLLAGVAALRAGGGKLAIATVARTAAALAVAVPEALVEGLPETPSGSIAAGAAAGVVDMAGSARAILLGPGMTEIDECCEFVAAVVGQLTEGVVVLDALALAQLERDPKALWHLDGSAVLTPNRRELALMLEIDQDTVDADPVAAVTEAARRYGAVVSLGGGESTVAGPDGQVWVDTSGGVGLGVSGSGDCEAGVLAGLLGRGADPAQGAVWAAHLHGRAGQRLAERIGRIGFLAREIADEIPRALSELAGD